MALPQTSNRSSAGTMLISAVREDTCLAFANTLAWRGSAAPVEGLGDFTALLAWAEAFASVPATVARELASWAREHPSTAAKVFAESIALREALYRFFGALACGDPLRNEDFAALSRALSEAPARRQLARVGVGYAWRIELGKIGRAGLATPTLLAPVLWSAADLMVGSALRRIRRCANDACLWLFLDESKNGTRRWCDMASCGNRAKSRRHYLKMKQG